MNAIRKTLSELRTLTNDQIAHAEGIAACRMTAAEFKVFADCVRIVRAERAA